MEYIQYDDPTVEQQFNLSVDQCGMNRMNFRKKGKNRELVKNDILVPPRQRNQANARERDRTHRLTTKKLPQYLKDTKRNDGVNTAFTILRTLIPTEPKDRKLSKIETLRLASSYISHLGTQLLIGAVEQPCLELLKSTNGNSSDYSRSQVCTFCMAVKKVPKIYQHNQYHQGPDLNSEHQFFFDPTSNAIVLAESSLKYSPTYI